MSLVVDRDPLLLGLLARYLALSLGKERIVWRIVLLRQLQHCLLQPQLRTHIVMQINVCHATSDGRQLLWRVASEKDLFARMPMRRKANEQVTLHPVHKVLLQTILLAPAQLRILRLALLS